MRFLRDIDFDLVLFSTFPDLSTEKQDLAVVAAGLPWHHLDLRPDRPCRDMLADEVQEDLDLDWTLMGGLKEQ